MAKNDKTIAVVGAGLVGSLEACMMARRGYHVDLYEYRDDIRTMEHVPGKSINLAMSIRGRTALAAVGAEDEIIKNNGIPMKGRMIHGLDGKTKCIPYDKDGQCIYSVGRRFINEVLLSKAEAFPNVTIHFGHKLTRIEVENGHMTFQKQGSSEEVSAHADLVIACDGAFSTVRRQMLKRPKFDYKQEYISSAYMELCIPPASDGDFAMPKNYLHIWPRGKFMMIALPNQDKTWTVTLFLPFEIFESLTSPDKLITFFETNYKDAIGLIGRQQLIRDYFATTHCPMISVKCSPYHVGSSAVLMGDAAHAMVPFYGQGMNCGMEDCVVLDELFTLFDDDISKALNAYSERRPKDAHAIVDLAMYNYVEMRDLVNSKWFLLRKLWDNFMYTIFPKTWIPLYTMVTFTRTNYHLCIEKRQWQDKTISRLFKSGIITIFSIASLMFLSRSMMFSSLNMENICNTIANKFKKNSWQY